MMLRKIRKNQPPPSEPAVPIPIYQAAIEGKEASFPLLLKLRRHLKRAEQEPRDDDLCQSLGWYYGQAHRIFRCAHGRITEMHICDDGSAIALTDKPRLFSNYCINNDSDVDRLLLQCDQMATETSRLLQGRDLQACLQLLYAAAKTLLCIKEARQAIKGKQRDANDAREDPSRCLKVVESHLAYAHEYHERAARLNAERFYSWGMLLGVLICAVALVTLGNGLPNRTIISSEILWLLASLLGGGIGAVVSVMWRMINGNLTVRYQAERRTLVLVGAFRPLIGAVFGTLVYALIQSEVLPLDAEVANPLYFYGVVGFLAGFSERWAPDLLQTTENGLQTTAVPVASGDPVPTTGLQHTGNNHIGTNGQTALTAP